MRLIVLIEMSVQILLHCISVMKSVSKLDDLEISTEIDEMFCLK
jgi:hypothetical protein